MGEWVSARVGEEENGGWGEWEFAVKQRSSV